MNNEHLVLSDLAAVDAVTEHARNGRVHRRAPVQHHIPEQEANGWLSIRSP